MSLNKKLIWIIGMLFIVSTAIASSYVFGKGEAIDLKVPCVDENNQMCDDTIDCNITITKPDGSLLNANKEMTWGNSYYNYTIEEEETNVLGEYAVNVFCTTGGQGFTTFTFEVQSTGNVKDEGITATLIIFLLIYFVTWFFLCGGENEQLKVLGWLAWIVNSAVGGIVIDSPTSLFLVLIMALIGIRNVFYVLENQGEVEGKSVL